MKPFAPLLLVLLAGCGSTPAPNPDASSTSAPTDGGQPAIHGEPVRWLNGTLNGTLTEVEATTYGVSEDEPTCYVWAQTEIRRVISGFATAIWDSQFPANERLAVRLGENRVAPHPHVVEGTSPLTINVASPFDVSEQGMVISVGTTSVGVTYKQPVRLEWSIQYEGAAAPEGVLSYC